MGEEVAEVQTLEQEKASLIQSNLLLQQEVVKLRKQIDATAEVLVYQNIIEQPPVLKESLMDRACASDKTTITSWKAQWIAQAKANSEQFDMTNNSVMKVYLEQLHKPIIVAGSGPSLKKNVDVLAKERNGICVVSCLHNFAFFEDKGVNAEFYVNLDAGDITIPEMFHGGEKDREWYLERTKDRTLVSCSVGHPEVHKMWRGRKLFFHAVAPDQDTVVAFKAAADLPFFNVGGNCLGSCLYMAKAVLGGCPIAFVGADFSFSRSRKFHPFSSDYDKQFAGVMPVTNVYGDRVYTWPSYAGFKAWFDYIVCGGQGNAPGIYYNCTEGGTLGAYPEGNLRQVPPMDLAYFLGAFNMSKKLQSVLDEAKGYPMLLF